MIIQDRFQKLHSQAKLFSSVVDYSQEQISLLTGEVVTARNDKVLLEKQVTQLQDRIGSIHNIDYEAQENARLF